MEKVDAFLELITKHKVILGIILTGLVSGGYLVARYRTSGLRKLLSEHDDILSDLSERLTGVRRELDKVQADLSEARARAHDAEARLKTARDTIERKTETIIQLRAEVTIAKQKVAELEIRERALLAKMRETHD